MQFSQIPTLIRHWLTEDPTPAPMAGDGPAKTVILIVLDGFGYRLFERLYADTPFLRRFVSDGTAQRIEAQFPSTTAVQLTTLHSGLSVGRSGVVEWRYYDPRLDRIVAPLPGTYQSLADDKSLSPEDLARSLPEPTLYRQLAAHGVESTCFQPRAYAQSTYTRHVCRGARQWPYRTLTECAVNLVTWLQTPTRGRRYAYVYIDVIDALAHAHGPDDPRVIEQVATICSVLERILAPQLARESATRVVLTADHGLTRIDGPVRYVDQFVPTLTGMLRTLSDGSVIAPTGGKRDLILHVQPERLAEAQARLCEALGDDARVARTAALIDAGQFGPVMPHARARLGDLIVLSGPHQRVWWWGDGRFELMDKRGDHGGLSADEMQIPLLTLSTD